jgi:hypothetical protein
VLVARGAQAGFLTAEAPVGANVTVLLTLTPPWANVLEAVGGGPIVVREVERLQVGDEPHAQITFDAPGEAEGGVAPDARGDCLHGSDREQDQHGLTNFELALTMMRLGCVTASARRRGSTTMAFDGKLLNRPSDPGGERAVAEALTIFYYGVYAPALPARVLSPNADGVDDTQTFAYKLVRPSTVTATLTGPGGIVVPLDAGSRAPGSYKFSWTGEGQPEGAWTFRTVADDDLGRHSIADRQFGLNNTLPYRAYRRHGSLARTACTRRPADRDFGGGIVKTLPLEASAGDGTISWRVDPAAAFSATATNEVGAVSPPPAPPLASARRQLFQLLRR